MLYVMKGSIKDMYSQTTEANNLYNLFIFLRGRSRISLRRAGGAPLRNKNVTE